MSVFDSLQVDSALSYLIAILIPALDAVLPALPGETAVIALGVATAGSAEAEMETVGSDGASAHGTRLCCDVIIAVRSGTALPQGTVRCSGCRGRAADAVRAVTALSRALMARVINVRGRSSGN